MTNSLEKLFDLKVGDVVKFKDSIITERRELEYADARLKKIKTGVVVGIYPNIIHIRYLVGYDNSVVLYRSLNKKDYLLGEVIRIGHLD